MTSVPGWRRVAVAGAVSTVGVLAWPSPSHATFPGTNGRLVFAASCGVLQANDQPGDCSRTGVSKFRAINPRTGKRLRFHAAGCPRRCNDRDPRFSPDGRRLAFNRSLPGKQARPLVSDAAGGGLREVRARGEGPAWSPDGRALAIGQAGGLRVYTPNGAFVSRVTTVSAFNLDWASRGRIAFVRDGNRELYTVSSRGGRLRRLTRCGGCFVGSVSWSPDGSKLAFYRLTRGPFGVGVFVMDADGSNLRRIARGATFPAWSPDGRRIAYIRDGRTGRDSRVVIARPDGTDRRVVYRIRAAVEPNVSDLAWQPRPRRRR